MISIGTSGFAFDDWQGPVFPLHLPRHGWLPYYERVLGFRALELNATFYTLLGERSLLALLERTSDRFRFVLKAHQALTHGDAVDARVLERFRGSLDLVRAAGKCAGTLAQFPPRFLPTPRHLARVEALHGKLGDPFFVEFRNRGWSGPWIWNRLERAGIAWCASDLPPLRLLPRLAAVATAPAACLRLHGRNRGWFDRPAERYDYSYPTEELLDLAGVVRKLRESARDVLVFFNNCRAGQAALNARRLAEILEPAQIVGSSSL